MTDEEIRRQLIVTNDIEELRAFDSFICAALTGILPNPNLTPGQAAAQAIEYATRILALRRRLLTTKKEVDATVEFIRSNEAQP